jgi:HK97 family phage major capsid protein
VRTIDEILADMQAIMSKPDGELTADDVLAYQALELELAQVQEASSPDEAEEGEPAAPEPAGATASAGRGTRTATAVAAARARHNAYTRVVVPAGRPSNHRREDPEADGFRNYLRTGRANADMQQGPQNAQTTGTGTSGGYLVPAGFLTRIVEVIKSFGGIFNDAEQLTTEAGNPLPMPTNDDTSNSGVVATESNAPGSGADLVFGQVQLSAFEYAASGASGNALAVPVALVQDSAFDIEAYIAKKLGIRIARKMATDAIAGTGTGQAQGVLQGVAGAQTAAAGVLAYNDLVDLVMSLDPFYWTNAKWYMSASSLGTVAKLKDGSNALIFRPGLVMIGDTETTKISSAIQVGPVLAPVVIDNGLANFATAAKWGIFGDMNEAYIWRSVREVEVLANPYTSANKRQIEYNAWARADGRQKNLSAYKVSVGQ